MFVSIYVPLEAENPAFRQHHDQLIETLVRQGWNPGDVILLPNPPLTGEFVKFRQMKLSFDKLKDIAAEERLKHFKRELKNCIINADVDLP